ncbi:hypothetical protein AMK23_27495 [Streptomyces sp. CB02130]|nr:hypothetical protein AMK23_27495 [Streptomyces sp. CB02130]
MDVGERGWQEGREAVLEEPRRVLSGCGRSAARVRRIVSVVASRSSQAATPGTSSSTASSESTSSSA